MRDRLNIETDPAELYPLMRKEEMDPEKDEGDSFPDDPVIHLLPEETAAGIFAEETVTDYLPEKSGIDFLREETESDSPREESLSDPLKMYLGDICTVLINIAGLPAISVPCGEAGAENLPVGLQLIGKPFDEADVLGFAAAYQKNQ